VKKRVKTRIWGFGQNRNSRSKKPVAAYLRRHDGAFPLPELLRGAAGELFRRVAPTPVASPRLIKLNRRSRCSSGSIRTCWRA